MEPRTWPERIAVMALVKQKLHDVDVKKRWEYRLPAIKATEEQLVAVEARLGEALDPSYRAFLAHAGGWPAFLQTIDLFGHADLLGGSRTERGAKLLLQLDEDVLRASGFRREQLLPIAATLEDVDVFVMTRRSAPKPGMVIWFAREEIDRFPSFDEYFLAMIDYNRSEIDAIVSGKR